MANKEFLTLAALAWLAPTEDDTRYVVIAPDSNEAIKDLLCAFPVYTHPAAPQPAGEVVVTKNESGQIVAVTRQDEEGRILSVIAESAAPQPAALPEPADKLREAAQKSLRIFDWLERRSIYQDAEVKEAHDLLRDALKGKQ